MARIMINTDDIKDPRVLRAFWGLIGDLQIDVVPIEPAGFADGTYALTLSSWDAMAMRIGNSTPTAFDLPTSEVSVLATGNPSDSGITDQGGDTSFRNRFEKPFENLEITPCRNRNSSQASSPVRHCKSCSPT